MISLIQLVAGADSVEEDIPCEPLGSGNRYSGGPADGMPIPDLAFEGPPVRETVVQEQGRLHAVVICPQALRGVARGKIALELEREVCALRRHSGKFESRGYVAESGLVREPRKRRYALKTLRLEPAYRDFHKRREAAVRRVFNIHGELLEVYGIGYAGAWSGSI